MSKRIVVNLIKYTSSAAIVALLAWTYVSLREFEGVSLMEQYRILCDAFTIPGLLLILVGAMIWISTQGALDGIAYCVRFAIFSLIPGKRIDRDEKYGDYVERRRGKRASGYGFLFISGLVTMVIAGVFMVLFYSLYNQV